MYTLENEFLRVEFNPIGAFIERIIDKKTGTDLLFPRQEIDGRDRGGMPVCAPVFGAASELGLSQHGFARNATWNAVSQTETSVTLSLPSQTEYKQIDVPAEFRNICMDFSLSLGQNSVVTCSLVIANKGQQPVLVTAGLHPYFPVTAGSKIKIVRGSANLSVTPGEDISGTIVLPAQDSTLTDIFGSTSRIAVTTHNLPVTVVWSGDSSRYVCVEPTAIGPITNKTSDELKDFYVAAGSSKNYTMKIDFQDV